MKPLVLFILFALSINGFAQVSSTFPCYEDVYKKFYSTYSVANLGDTIKISFEKRKEGWYIIKFQPFKNRVLGENSLFIARGEKVYKKLNFPLVHSKDENLDIINATENNRWESEQYKIQPYYGYKGWEDDVINDFASEQKLPDSTLYLLARAYFSKASIIRNLYQENKIDRGILNQYLFDRRKSIEYYYRLKEQNPSFETIVGSALTKWSNEIVGIYYELCLYTSEEEAKKELREGLYDEFMISTAKNFLKSCGKNAVIFTNGDTDTYPLIYVQEVLNFRKDVSIINVSLLYLAEYVEYVKEKKGFSTSFSMAEIKKLTQVVVCINEKEQFAETGISLEEAIEYMKDTTNLIHTEYGDYFTIPAVDLILFSNNEKIKWHNSRRHIYSNSLFILDFINRNRWNRPICFSSTVGDENLIGLQNHLETIGFVYCMTKNKQEDKYIINPIVKNTVQNFDLLMSGFEIKAVDKIKESDKGFIAYYRSFASSLSNELVNRNKLDSALIVADYIQKMFPDSVLAYNTAFMNFVELYYKKGQNKKAFELFTLLAKNAENDVYLKNNDYKASYIKNLCYIVALNDPSKKAVLLKKYAKYYAEEENPSERGILRDEPMK